MVWNLPLPPTPHGPMKTAPVALAADHAGYELKQALIREVEAPKVPVVDLGTPSPDSVDYPDLGDARARCIREGRAARGVLVCGTGIGISISANRHKGIRAAVCHD